MTKLGTKGFDLRPDKADNDRVGDRKVRSKICI